MAKAFSNIISTTVLPLVFQPVSPEAVEAFRRKRREANLAKMTSTGAEAQRYRLPSPRALPKEKYCPSVGTLQDGFRRGRIKRLAKPGLF